MKNDMLDWGLQQTSTHVLTALMDFVDYQSNFKLHKNQSLLLLKALALSIEIGWQTCTVVLFCV